ncbi:MAG: hypothetical protein WBM76_17555 [Woeseiaceae bacterium]
MTWSRLSLIALLSLACCSAWADGSSPGPRITAQGFSIDAALRAEAGQFSSVRVRIEAPSRIAKLLITDGDVETDLASTTDRTLFAMYGLERRPMNAFDVTLDLAPYINSQLTAAATYRIAITVIDRSGGVAQSALTITIIDTDNAAVETTVENAVSQRLEESTMVLRREGLGRVEPAPGSLITWLTHESVNVTLRLRAAETGSELRRADASVWGNTFTRDALARHLKDTPAAPYIDVAAARNGAAGTVVAVSGNDGGALIRFTASSTSVSALGTAVTLVAEVRY